MPAHHFKILIVEPNPDNIETLITNLEAEGYFVDHVTDGPTALNNARSTPPDLILTNWMLPGLTGLELCRKLGLHAETMSIPIFVLGFGADKTVRPRAQKMGVSAFFEGPDLLDAVFHEIVENFGPIIQVSRSEPIRAAGIVVEPLSKTAYRGGQAMRLSPQEFQLLSLLMQKQERIVSRAQIIEFVWGSDALIDPRTVDVLIGRLRRSLAKVDGPSPIKSIRGKGYQLVKVPVDYA